VTTAGAKKLRVYEIAKDLKMSSDAVVEMIRALGVQVRGHMSTVDRRWWASSTRRWRARRRR